MTERVKLTGVDKRPVTDPAFAADFASAQTVGKVEIGDKALYYKDGFKRFCVPFAEIDRVFTRISGCDGKLCCGTANFDYYRLVLQKGEREIANIIFGHDESEVDAAQALLREKRPEIQIGYIKPEKR